MAETFASSTTPASQDIPPATPKSEIPCPGYKSLPAFDPNNAIKLKSIALPKSIAMPTLPTIPPLPDFKLPSGEALMAMLQQLYGIPVVPSLESLVDQIPSVADLYKKVTSLVSLMPFFGGEFPPAYDPATMLKMLKQQAMNAAIGQINSALSQIPDLTKLEQPYDLNKAIQIPKFPTTIDLSLSKLDLTMPTFSKITDAGLSLKCPYNHDHPPAQPYKHVPQIDTSPVPSSLSLGGGTVPNNPISGGMSGLGGNKLTGTF